MFRTEAGQNSRTKKSAQEISLYAVLFPFRQVVHTEGKLFHDAGNDQHSGQFLVADRKGRLGGSLDGIVRQQQR